MTETFLVAGFCALLLAGAGGLLTDVGPWYRNLNKPALQPPDWLFGPAWTLILGMAAASAALAWHAGTLAASPWQHTQVIILFATNATFHLIWSPLFFKLKRPDWALFEVAFLWSSCLALVVVLRPISSTASWLVVPYLAWVTFAAWLNYTIVSLNPPFGARAKARPGALPLDPAKDKSLEPG